ncbi:MAG: hypothetical protein ACM3X9_00055, partial [Bacillota bacterium]
ARQPMMNKKVVFSETIFTTAVPERIFAIADECLLEIRLVETRKESAGWVYEYEVKGDSGRIEKFLVRLKKLGIVK